MNAEGLADKRFQVSVVKRMNDARQLSLAFEPRGFSRFFFSLNFPFCFLISLLVPVFTWS